MENKKISSGYKGVIVIILSIFLGVYLMINIYYEKKVRFRSFEECLSSVSDSNFNWMTRKDSIKYCKEETF